MAWQGAAAAVAAAKGIMDTAGPIVNTAVSAGIARRNFKDTVKLANTAHTREVHDLIGAGLNPILSAGGSGAQAPQASMPDIDTKSGSSTSASEIMEIRKQKELYPIEKGTATAVEAKAHADAATALLNKELTQKELNARGLLLAAELQNRQLAAKNTSALTNKMKVETEGIDADNAERKAGAKIYDQKGIGVIYKAVKELFK